MVLFKPNYRFGHPEKYVFSLSREYFLDRSIQKIVYLIMKTEALDMLVMTFTPRIIYMCYTKWTCQDQSILKIVNLILKVKSLVQHTRVRYIQKRLYRNLKVYSMVVFKEKHLVWPDRCTARLYSPTDACCRSSRNIAYFTLKIIHLYHQKMYLQFQSIQKNISI